MYTFLNNNTQEHIPEQLMQNQALHYTEHRNLIGRAMHYKCRTSQMPALTTSQLFIHTSKNIRHKCEMYTNTVNYLLHNGI